jgi:hypothetical protein
MAGAEARDAPNDSIRAGICVTARRVFG